MGSRCLVFAIFFIIKIDALVNALYIGNEQTHHKKLNNLKHKNDHSENNTNYEKLIPKCCAMNFYVHVNFSVNKICVRYNSSEAVPDFSDVKVYDKDNITKEKTTLKNSFKVIPGKFNNETFKQLAVNVVKFGYNTYLSETRTLYVEEPHKIRRWIPRDANNFCVDYIKTPEPGKHEPQFFVIMEFKHSKEDDNILTSAILVSCVFLLLVLVVYSLLTELRKLSGMILMAYVASLLGAFLLLAVIRISRHKTVVCFILTYSIYFLFLASFCWMNVMSYDIWWTFRGYAKARPTHRRGERFKFLMYCLYAWGLPLAMTIALAVVNSIDLSPWPWIITPNIPRGGCFIRDDAKLVYLHMPMMILILCNWIFYLMTAFNVWRLSRGTDVLDSGAAGSPAAHRTHQQRFMVYLKLLIVMGLNWVLEVGCYVVPNSYVWHIADIYNVLTGLAIFLIFVCKKRILKKLLRRYRGYQESRQTPSN